MIFSSVCKMMHAFFPGIASRKRPSWLIGLAMAMAMVMVLLVALPVLRPQADVVRSWSVSGTVEPAQNDCENGLIINCGFENDEAWTLTNMVYTTEQAHSGSRALVSNFDLVPGFQGGTAIQSVMIPADVVSATLTFFWKNDNPDPASDPNAPPGENDALHITVSTPPGEPGQITYGVSSLFSSSDTGWQMGVMDFAQLEFINQVQGKSVSINFFVYSNGAAPHATFYIDDVRLETATDIGIPSLCEDGLIVNCGFENNEAWQSENFLITTEQAHSGDRSNASTPGADSLLFQPVTIPADPAEVPGLRLRFSWKNENPDTGSSPDILTARVTSGSSPPFDLYGESSSYASVDTAWQVGELDFAPFLEQIRGETVTIMFAVEQDNQTPHATFYIDDVELAVVEPGSNDPPLVQDGDFEDGPAGAAWEQVSRSFATPLCSIDRCGTQVGSGPRSGTHWVWFGGTSSDEAASLRQRGLVPEGSSTLSFWLAVPAASGSAQDVFSVLLDESELFRLTGADAGPYRSYQPVNLDISSFADGASHTLTFSATLAAAASSSASSFFVDDVALGEAVGSDPPAYDFYLAAEPGPYSIELTWEPVGAAGAGDYRVTRALSGTSSFAPISGPLSNTFYLDTDPALQPDQSYCYRVEAASAASLSRTACTTFGNVALWLPDVWAAPGTSTIIPVNIRNADQVRIASGNIWLAFDPAVISPTAVLTSPLTAAGYQFELSTRSDEPGVVIISATPRQEPPPRLYGEGALFQVQASVSGADGSESLLSLREFVAGSGGTALYPPETPKSSLPLHLQSSTLAVSNQAATQRGDISADGQLNEDDAALALRMASGTRRASAPERYAADMNNDGTVTAADATLVFSEASSARGKARLRPGVASTDTVHIAPDTVVGAPGGSVSTRLRISTVEGLAGGDLLLSYDPAVVAGITDVEAVELAHDFALAFRDNGSGSLRIAMAGPTPMTGSGAILRLQLQIDENALPGSSSPLYLTETHLNGATGRDFARSALQRTITRGQGEMLIIENNIGSGRTVYVPLLRR